MFDSWWMFGYLIFYYPIFIVPHGGVSPKRTVLVCYSWKKKHTNVVWFHFFIDIYSTVTIVARLVTLAFFGLIKKGMCIWTRERMDSYIECRHLCKPSVFVLLCWWENGTFVIRFIFFHFSIDATEESGRLGRLINHSKTAGNCHTKLTEINNKPYLMLIASRDIAVGEELLYDYGDRNKDSLESHPWLKS